VRSSTSQGGLEGGRIREEDIDRGRDQVKDFSDTLIDAWLARACNFFRTSFSVIIHARIHVPFLYTRTCV
jgi:hypothetical protein